MSGAISASFTYNGNGNHVKATLGGVTTYYVGNHFEWRGSTSTMMRYYYAGGQRVAMRVGSNAPSYLLGDHLGSTSVTANSSGSKVAELRYHPWGGTRFSSGTTPTARRYTGQIEDAAIGLYFYNARYYDPALGRFIQADTIIPNPANPQSLNRYAYVLNNPLRYTDPTGHFEEDEIDRYLEYQLGITDADERLRIIAKWKADIPWWAIIGPGGATYGDILDGAVYFDLQTALWDKGWSVPISHITGVFQRDDQHNTFRFSGEMRVLDTYLAGWLTDHSFNSLQAFHEVTTDVIWARRNQEGQIAYMGGTGYAANGAAIRWDQYGAYVLAVANTPISSVQIVAGALSVNLEKVATGWLKLKAGDVAARTFLSNYVQSVDAHARLRGLID